ncbi:MAG TPA: hypothetical protein PKA64_11325, partial [Myxococcota bacterium]|nr:hypothetical protein [Myxococcota bacterium]
MASLTTRLAALDTATLLLACLTLGLAPFTPPHVLEKLGMLARGELVRPIDVFDLLLHGAPWAALAAHAVARAATQPSSATSQ